MELSKKNRDAISQLAQSSDAQKLMALLKQQSGGVQQAAQRAAAGEVERISGVNRMKRSEVCDDEGGNLRGGF